MVSELCMSNTFKFSLFYYFCKKVHKAYIWGKSNLFSMVLFCFPWEQWKHLLKYIHWLAWVLPSFHISLLYLRFHPGLPTLLGLWNLSFFIMVESDISGPLCINCFIQSNPEENLRGTADKNPCLTLVKMEPVDLFGSPIFGWSYSCCGFLMFWLPRN